MEHLLIIKRSRDFSGGPVVNNLPVNSEDMGSMPGPGRFHMPPGNQAHKMQLLQGGANLDSILDLFLWLSDQFSRSVVSDSLQPYGLQHSKLPCPSPTPRAYSDSRPLSRWFYPNISSSVIPFSSQHQGLSWWSQLFESGGQSIGASASALVLPMNIQDWFPLGWTGWISLQSKELSRIFSNTTVQKHQFFGTQLLYGPTLTSIHDYWKNHSWLDRSLSAKWCLCFVICCLGWS